MCNITKEEWNSLVMSVGPLTWCILLYVSFIYFEALRSYIFAHVIIAWSATMGVSFQAVM